MTTGCILVLDDDPDLTLVMSDLIRALSGRGTVVAHSLAELQTRGHEAIACDLALLDVNLGYGEPSGVDAFEWLRQSGFRGRVYFFTGHAGDHPLVRQASSIPGTSVVSKPIGMAELDALLRSGAT
jgi:CheY-like chemotaxis protein